MTLSAAAACTESQWGARDIAIEVPALSVLEDDGQVCSRKEQVAKSYDVRVAEADVGLELARDVLIDVPAPLQVLDGNLLSCLPVHQRHSR